MYRLWHKLAACLLLPSYGAIALLGHGLHHLPGFEHRHAHEGLVDHPHSACEHGEHQHACHQHAATDHTTPAHVPNYLTGEANSHDHCSLCQFMSQGQNHEPDAELIRIVASVPGAPHAPSMALSRLHHAPYAPRGPPLGDLATL